MILHPPPVRYTLPADIYDTLELAAEAFGGIGAYQMYNDVTREDPMDPHGLLEFARGERAWQAQPELQAVGITTRIHDNTFMRMRGQGYGRRIPFATWCRRLGVARGA